MGRQITTTNALGQTSLTVYDTYGRAFLNVANWDGAPITEVDDCAFPPVQPDANLCTVTEYDYDRRSATVDALGNRTEFGYDALGRVVTTTRYLGLLPVTTVTHYDLLGQRVGQTDPRGNTTSYVYDALGRQIETVTPEGLITRQYYDIAGRVERTQDAGGEMTAYEYDGLGRRIAVSNPLSQTTRFAYDALGNQTAITDANGIVTAYEYDALNRLVAVVENHQPTQPPDHQTNVRTEYAYDILSNRIVITNARAYTQSFTTYDVLGRPVIVEDALGNRTFTAYDAGGQNRLGRRSVVTDADGLVTHYRYDGLNRLIEIQYPDATVEYAYDALGRRTAMTDTSGVTTYQYDDLGRLVRVTDPFTGVVEYGYDLVGNRTALTVTHNAQPTTTYYAFDADNRLIQVTDWTTGTTTYAYDPAGRLSATTLPNGVVTTHSYDPAGRLTALTHTHNGALLARYAYTLDATGNRTRVTETVNGVTREISYTYDSLYRLTAADYSTGEAYAYQYDPVGNREVMTDAIGIHTYVYDPANRLTRIQLPDSSIQGYTWDNRGNLLADGTFTYTYSAAGRMVRAESITATLVYTYNADGLRVAQFQSVASVQSVDTFTWDWVTPVPELLSDGESLYLIGYDTLGWQSGTAWTFVLPNALGSVRQETDAAGAVTAVREWSPYGEEVGEAQAGLGFTGEWFDANVGLTYLRARWYDGESGRFTQQDPLRLEENLYAYASANPLLFVDPTGYFSNDTIADSFGKASFHEVLLMFFGEDDSAPSLLEDFSNLGKYGDPFSVEDLVYKRWGLLKLLQDARIGDHLYALKVGQFGKSQLVHLGELTGIGCSIWVGNRPLLDWIGASSSIFLKHGGISPFGTERYVGFYLNNLPYRDTDGDARLPDMATMAFSGGTDFVPGVGWGVSFAYTVDRYGNAYLTGGLSAQVGYSVLPFDVGYTEGWVTGPSFYGAPEGGYAPTEAHLAEAIPGISAGLNYNVFFLSFGAERSAFGESWQKYWIKSITWSLAMNLTLGGSAQVSITKPLSKEWSINPGGWDKIDRVRRYTFFDIQR